MKRQMNENNRILLSGGSLCHITIRDWACLTDHIVVLVLPDTYIIYRQCKMIAIFQVNGTIVHKTGVSKAWV